MPETILTEFHRGWMIEVASLEGGFQSTCYSPFGRALSDRTLYDHAMTAWHAGTIIIDSCFARYALVLVLRDAYEAGQLKFEEWQALHHSLSAELQSP